MSCQLAKVDPFVCLRDVFARIGDARFSNSAIQSDWDQAVHLAELGLAHFPSAEVKNDWHELKVSFGTLDDDAADIRDEPSANARQQEIEQIDQDPWRRKSGSKS